MGSYVRQYNVGVSAKAGACDFFSFSFGVLDHNKSLISRMSDSGV